MVLSKPLDYRTGDLFWQKKVIDWFRVAEVLAEHGLHASLRVGNTVLAARRLPDEVQMRTDNHKGLIRIGVQKKEKELAARTARLVRAELNRLGMEIRAVVRRSKRGRLGEEHDMVIEVVATEDKGPIRKISGELKLRRLWSKEGLNTARLAIQKEAATECEWWQTEASTGKWAGRLLVLVRWSSLAAEGDPEIRIDYVPRDCVPRGFAIGKVANTPLRLCRGLSDHLDSRRHHHRRQRCRQRLGQIRRHRRRRRPGRFQC